MNEFMTLEEFLLLKDPTDRSTLPRPAHRDQYLANDWQRGNGLAQDYVKKYRVAKKNWDLFGEDGPPPGTICQLWFGSRVEILSWETYRERWPEYAGKGTEDRRWIHCEAVTKREMQHAPSIVTRAIWYVQLMLPGDSDLQ